MADLGFRETSIEPVVSDPDVPYALHEEDLPQLYEEYEKLALEMLAREERGEGENFGNLQSTAHDADRTIGTPRKKA